MMYIHPNMAALRKRLDEVGIGWVSGDEEEEDEYGNVTHTERTGIVTDGKPITVTYAWERDLDERKRGKSYGYPAYLQCLIGDGEPCILDIEEIVEEAMRNASGVEARKGGAEAQEGA